LIKVPVILAAQPLNARRMRWLDYAEVANGLCPLCASITMLDLLHGER